MKGNLYAAVADYDRASKSSPCNQSLKRRNVKLAQGKVAEAVADFTEAVKAYPKEVGDAYARLSDTGKPCDAGTKLSRVKQFKAENYFDKQKFSD